MSEPRDVDGVVKAQEAGEGVEFLFFWGHRPSRDGAPTASCLSQWWQGHPFTVDGVAYATAEHYMMAGKARLFGDAEMEERVLAAGHPREAKELGGRVRGFDEAAWREHRSAIVARGNLAKFGQHPDIGGFLLGSAGRVLVEASPVDRIWGIGLAADDERAARAATWRGLNLLGFALMDVRAALRA
ncbi:NADAR family protein [Actinomadura parmotrematis]|uniref:NADAR family protein n=1 Tax=Actinomadura parmotrematis TaxID=2864039 RepID=A0ABS7G1S9_9ACTN|nr:NADAR family protein [Actinomadura parmotrematis]MBW8486617.1 NADAR family protein [Actinomadura parmotrematis]